MPGNEGGSPPDRAARPRAGGQPPAVPRSTIVANPLAPADPRARVTGHRGRCSSARCTMAWARRTYLLSARSRTLLTPSAWFKASAALLDRPSAVTGASARPANLSTSDWSAGGGWMSGCSTISASRCWLRWTTSSRRYRMRQPLVIGGPPCPCPPGPVLAGGPGAAGGPLEGGETLVGGAEPLGGDTWPVPWSSALAPGATSWQ